MKRKYAPRLCAACLGVVIYIDLLYIIAQDGVAAKYLLLTSLVCMVAPMVVGACVNLRRNRAPNPAMRAALLVTINLAPSWRGFTLSLFIVSCLAPYFFPVSLADSYFAWHWTAIMIPTFLRRFQEIADGPPPGH